MSSRKVPIATKAPPRVTTCRRCGERAGSMVETTRDRAVRNTRRGDRFAAMAMLAVAHRKLR
jgi:hypothetical protein